MLKVKATDKVQELYTSLQLTKKNVKADEKVKFLVCVINNDKVVLDTFMTLADLNNCGDDSKDDSKEAKNDEHTCCHAMFTKALQESDEPRYGIMDFKGKVYFVSYIPENAKRALKMQYAAVRQIFKDSLTGVNNDMQCTDAGDLHIDEFNSKIKAI